MDGEIEKYLRDIRNSEMPAMRSALAQLALHRFQRPGDAGARAGPSGRELTAQQEEAWDAMHKPKASRRAALAKEYMETTAAMLETWIKSPRSSPPRSIISDPVIDQLLAIKQTAWLLRNTARRGSILVSNGLAAGSSRRRCARPTRNSSAASRPRGMRWNWRPPACNCRRP